MRNCETFKQRAKGMRLFECIPCFSKGFDINPLMCLCRCRGRNAGNGLDGTLVVAAVFINQRLIDFKIAVIRQIELVYRIALMTEELQTATRSALGFLAYSKTGAPAFRGGTCWEPFAQCVADSPEYVDALIANLALVHYVFVAGQRHDLSQRRQLMQEFYPVAGKTQRSIAAAGRHQLGFAHIKVLGGVPDVNVWIIVMKSEPSCFQAALVECWL